MQPIVQFADVATAAQRIAPAAHRTPVLTSRAADERTGATLFFKAEHLQRVGAFKFRGAYNALTQFDPAQRSQGVLAYSSGNHAQAIALAARMLSIPAVIVMPHDAPRGKLQATRAYGAEVISYDRYSEDREALGRKLAAERGMTVIPPFDHPHVIAGQGTAAFELFHQVGPLDLLVTCLGGGGLTAGCALAAHALSPGCVVIAVEPEAGNDVQQSLATGSIVRIDTPQTIADGAQTQSTGEIVFPILQALVREVVTVSDRQLIDTMRFFAERMKQVIEPTGCLAAAAVLEAVIPVRGRRVGIVLSGGNIDAARFAELLTQGAAPG